MGGHNRSSASEIGLRSAKPVKEILLVPNIISRAPYLFNLVSLFGRAAETRVVEYASFFYALDMAALMVILVFFTHELAIE